MTKFLNGPAAGQTLMLKRAPIYLRVVRLAIGVGSSKWDALDQPTDNPETGEIVFAYKCKCKGEPGTVHLNMGRKGGGWYAVAEYELCEVQPTDAEMRSTPAWQAWCRATHSKEKTS